MKSYFHCCLSTLRPVTFLLALIWGAMLLTPRSVSAVSADYFLPWRSEVVYTVTQGWDTGSTGGSHNNDNTRYAYDFNLPEGTVLRAARAGTVRWVKESMAGCSDIQSNTGNGVVIDHSDGSATLYMHMKQNSVFVEVGNRVRQGAVIGLSGDTGYVTNCNTSNGNGDAHLHFSKQNQGGLPWTTTVKPYFAEYPTLDLVTGSSYMSRNYDGVVLFAHAPVPSTFPNNGYQNATPRQPLRPQNNTADLGIYPISGPGPISDFNGWHDDASAVHVQEGVTVTFYSDVNYGGVAELFDNKDRWLPDNPVGNDTISSLRWDGVWLFEELDFNNADPYIKKAEFLNRQDGKLSDNYIGDNTTSSIVVGHNWQVVLYQNGNPSGGQTLTLTEGVYPNLSVFSCSGCGGDGTWNN